MDEKGNKLDCFEVRDRLANKKKIVLNKDRIRNGSSYVPRALLDFLLSQMFYFTTYTTNTYNSQSVAKQVNCMPKGYDLFENIISSARAQHKQSPRYSQEEFEEKLKEYMKNLEIVTVSKETLLNK